MVSWKKFDGIGGRYFENCQEADIDDPSVAAHALDPEAAQRLWAVSTDVNRQN